MAALHRSPAVVGGDGARHGGGDGGGGVVQGDGVQEVREVGVDCADVHAGAVAGAVLAGHAGAVAAAAALDNSLAHSAPARVLSRYALSSSPSRDPAWLPSRAHVYRLRFPSSHTLCPSQHCAPQILLRLQSTY